MLVPMDRDREVPTIVKLGIGVGLGYALYRLLEFAGGDLGPGTRRAGVAIRLPAVPSRPPADRRTAVPPIEVAPVVEIPSPVRPRDEQPVEVRVRPSPIDPSITVIEMDGRFVSVGELIARIDEGGRRDVVVAVTGDAREGGWREIRDALGFAGIEISLRQPPIGSV
jgi:hypothetical protein